MEIDIISTFSDDTSTGGPWDRCIDEVRRQGVRKFSLSCNRQTSDDDRLSNVFKIPRPTSTIYQSPLFSTSEEEH